MVSVCECFCDDARFWRAFPDRGVRCPAGLVGRSMGLIIDSPKVTNSRERGRWASPGRADSPQWSRASVSALFCSRTNSPARAATAVAAAAAAAVRRKYIHTQRGLAGGVDRSTDDAIRNLANAEG